MIETKFLPLAVVGGGLGLFLSSHLVARGTLPVVRRNADRWGLVDRPGERKVHAEPTPLGGGIAIFAATIFPIVLGMALAWLLSRQNPDWLPEELAVYLPGIVRLAPQVGAIALGGAVIFVLGLVDDVRGLGPWSKLAIQVGVAIGLVLVGVRATLFVPHAWVGGLVTVGWIVLMTNSFNLLDNMDGLSAGVAIVASFCFFWVTVQTGQWFVACSLLVFLGALTGFLRDNFPPASIFMGDAGSLFVGYHLSVLTVVSTFTTSPYPIFPVALPLLVLAVPLFDTASVVWIRWREGRPLFVGDRRHLSHRLVAMGMSPRGAVLAIYLLTLATGIGSLLLYRTDGPGAILLVIQLVAILALVAILETSGRNRDA